MILARIVGRWDTVYIIINKISRFGISSLHIKSYDVVCFREADILRKADIYVMISLTLKVAWK
jgi:hypothetical protein